MARSPYQMFRYTDGPVLKLTPRALYYKVGLNKWLRSEAPAEDLARIHGFYTAPVLRHYAAGQGAWFARAWARMGGPKVDWNAEK